MLKKLYLIFFITLLILTVKSQNIPIERTVDWTKAGLKDTSTSNYIQINVQDWGLVGDSYTPNDSTFNIILDSIQNKKAIIIFGIGEYLFKKTIYLKSNTVIKGQGSKDTKLIMDLDSTGHGIVVNGTMLHQTNSGISFSAYKNDKIINFTDTTGFKIGDWVKIGKKDDHLITSHSWALNTVGQITQIENIDNHKITFTSALRLDYKISDSVYIVKINPVENVGIECLNIVRLDETPTQQSSNIRFNYAVNSWVNGIESYKCTFSHIDANRSSNLYIGNSYFHHAHNYGGGGRGYGVMLHLTTNECLIENNIFEHLRHSMIVQAGANANVFTFNFSFDPYRIETPTNAAGDIVLHGNYAYANLFEQNICSNIAVDNSHGPNGPFNTFFRNRAEGYGIYFTATNSPFQNIVANEVNSDTVPFNIISYIVQGNNQFESGNIVYDTITPTNTSLNTFESYAYTSKPDFVPNLQWSKIGSQEKIKLHQIPAYNYYKEQVFYGDNCSYPTVIATNLVNSNKEKIGIYPNPTNTYFQLNSNYLIENIEIFNNLGQSVFSKEISLPINKYHIAVNNWNKGVYNIIIQTEKETFYHHLIIK